MECETVANGVKAPKEARQLWTRNEEQQVVLEDTRIVLVGGGPGLPNLPQLNAIEGCKAIGHRR
jgi:hypothetical protein